jgi:hypothetical protein
LIKGKRVRSVSARESLRQDVGESRCLAALAPLGVAGSGWEILIEDGRALRQKGAANPLIDGDAQFRQRLILIKAPSPPRAISWTLTFARMWPVP